MEADIRAILPHRYPFLLVDRLIQNSDDSFECIKNVTFNEPFFAGHFPDEPATPGTGYLTGIDAARFRRKVVPGDQLRLTGQIMLNRRGLVKVQSVALVGEEVAAEASLSFLYSRN